MTSRYTGERAWEARVRNTTLKGREDEKAEGTDGQSPSQLGGIMSWYVTIWESGFYYRQMDSYKFILQ